VGDRNPSPTSAGEAGPPTWASDALRRASPAVARSFRLHRPRGAPCGAGYCGLCLRDTSSGRALACQASPPARGGGLGVDPLRPLGRLAERWPPWFWERRFLRPAVARRLYLEALRRLSAAGGLDARPAVGGTPAAPRKFAVQERAEVVVGPGGAAAGGIALGVYGDRTLGVARTDAIVEVRFERLVLETGAYLRPPPIAGNDLPGVLGLAALERYAAAEGLPRGARIAIWGPPARRERARDVAVRGRCPVVWEGERAPRRLDGRGRLEVVVADRRIPCDLFVVAVAQPALELAGQAGATLELTTDELPILRAGERPGWLELRGEAAATASGVPAVAASGEAFACLCEDVRVRDVRAAVAAGFAHPELVKRRTGAMTGYCQGRLCAALVLSLLAEAGAGAAPTTARPPLHPIPLAALIADG
jgi:bacterioferritin-associated ferredoxin